MVSVPSKKHKSGVVEGRLRGRRFLNVGRLILLLWCTLTEAVPLRARFERSSDFSYQHNHLDDNIYRPSHHPHYEKAVVINSWLLFYVIFCFEAYLNEYGYLSMGVPSPHAFQNALKNFQDLVGIERTGILDAPTVEEMQQPRCGNTDISQRNERNRRFGKVLSPKVLTVDGIFLKKKNPPLIKATLSKWSKYCS